MRGAAGNGGPYRDLSDAKYFALESSSGATINGTGIILNVTSDSGIDVSNITFDGGGINLKISPTAPAGSKTINLTDVDVLDSSGFGIVVSDDSAGLLQVIALYVTVDTCPLYGFFVSKEDGVLAFYAGATEIYNVDTTGSDYDGFHIQQEGSGTLYANCVDCIVESVGEDGIDVEEFGDGNCVVTIDGCFTEKIGSEHVEIEDHGAGSVDLVVVDADCFDSIGANTDGFELIEDGSGGITATFENSVVSHMTKDGVRVSSDDAGDVDIEFTYCDITNCDSDGFCCNDGDVFANHTGTICLLFDDCLITDNCPFEDDNAGIFLAVGSGGGEIDVQGSIANYQDNGPNGFGDLYFHSGTWTKYGLADDLD